MFRHNGISEVNKRKEKRTSGGNLFSINTFIPGVPLPEGIVW